jgi:hypothetical protein
MTVEERRGFDRQGHLTELALDVLDEGLRAEDPAFFDDAERHLAECAACRLRRDERREHDAAIVMGPSLLVRQRAARRTPRSRLVRGALVLGGALALAATLFLLTRPRPLPMPEGDFRAKGGELHLQVHVHDGQRVRLVGDGDTVAPGDKAGFAVRASRAGHLLVFGWDETGRVYPVWPAASDAAGVSSRPLAPQQELTPLPAAVRFDAIGGEEHLVAVFCPQPFTLSNIVPSGVVTAPLPRPAGCSVRALALHKRP